MAVIKYKKKHELARHPFKKYDSDFCYDLYATSREEISPNVYRYGLGLAISIDKDHLFENKALDYLVKKLGLKVALEIKPRSSIFETGMVLANSEGTVDELYRGEMKAVFYQVILGKKIYEVGDRVCQCKLSLTFPITWDEVDELDDTSRGEGGFGHTGRK